MPEEEHKVTFTDVQEAPVANEQILSFVGVMEDAEPPPLQHGYFIGEGSGFVKYTWGGEELVLTFEDEESAEEAYQQPA